VCIGIIILRYRDPERPRSFRVPLGNWLIPSLGGLSCIFLMVYLPPASWWRFVGWLVLGMAVYLAYGYSHSLVGREVGRAERTSGPLKLAAAGVFLLAMGLFTIPHDAGPLKLLAQAGAAADPDHTRSLIG